ncbi:hypothetical protein LCGC14_2674360, partial [marine sediment metagenome]
LMGDIAGNLGAIGGDNNLLAHTHGFTQPSAHGITQPTFTFNSHYHVAHFAQESGSQLSYEQVTGIPSWTSNLFFGATGSGFVTAYTKGVKTSSVTGATTRTQDVALSNNHSGGSVNAVSESRTDKNIPKYLACKYIMRIK